MEKITNYENFKKEVKEAYPIRKSMTISELNIDFEDAESRNGCVNIEGVKIKLSSGAFKTLLKTLKISDSFMGKFTDIFGMNSRNQLVKIIKNKLVSEKNMKVAVYISPITMTVVAVTDAEKPYISPEFYFDMVENVIGENNLDINNMSVSIDGNVQISTIKNTWGLDIPSLRDEAFHTGVIMTTGPTEDIAIDPYVLRLICQNGMVGPRRLEMGPRLKSNSLTDIGTFMAEVKKLSETNKQFQGIFTEQVKKMHNISASFEEMFKFRDLVAAKTTDKIDARVEAVLDRFFPIGDVKKSYKEKGVDLDLLTHRHWKNAKTHMTTWDLLNSLTDVASHDYGIGISEHSKNELRKNAGMFMFKKEFDAEFIL